MANLDNLKNDCKMFCIYKKSKIGGTLKQCCGAEIIYFRLRLRSFGHNFGSGSSFIYSHILALETVLKHYCSTIQIEVEITFTSS